MGWLQLSRLWLGYQLLRLALWVTPDGTRDVFAHQINEALDMHDNPARQAEWDGLISAVLKGRDTGGKDG